MAFGKKPGLPRPEAQHVLPPAPLMPEADRPKTEVPALGISPDDESNVLMTDDVLREREEKERHVMLAFIGQLNADLPDGVNVQPYFMIPQECWNGPCGDFLARYLGLTPYARWNMLPLPKDPRSGEALGITSHPGAPPATFVRSVEAVLAKLESGVKATGENFQAAMMIDIVAVMRRKVRGVAWAITAKAMGEDTLKRPRQMFYNETFPA